MADGENKLAAGFSAAWELVVDLPLKRMGGSIRPPEWSAGFFPLFGVLFGAAVLIAGALGKLLFNPVAGAVIYALAGIALWEVRDSGRGSRLLATCLGERFRGTAWAEALENASSSAEGICIQPAAPIYWIDLAVRFLILCVLAHFGAGAWLMVVFLCGFSLQGALALGATGEDGKALFPGGVRGEKVLMGTLCLLGLCFLVRFPAGTLAAGILFYFARQKGTALLAEAPDAVNDRIALVSAGAEQLWLLLGFLLAL